MRIKVNEAPLTYMEFPNDTPKDVIEHKIKVYKQMLKQRNNTSISTLRNYIHDLYDKPHRRVKYDGHGIEPLSTSAKINGNPIW